ncbi:MAG: hypothetical protein CMI25_02900 [Opitutae bacterium]|nr:hypothetical protein [Opitutae bacterium]
MLGYGWIVDQFQEIFVRLCSKQLFQGEDGGHPGPGRESLVDGHSQNLLARTSPAQDFLLGMKPSLGAGGGQQVGQIDGIALLQVRKLLVLPALRNDPRDVATGSSLEARIAPASDEKPARTVTVDVGNPSALDEIFLFLCEARTVGRNPVDE